MLQDCAAIYPQGTSVALAVARRRPGSVAVRPTSGQNWHPLFSTSDTYIGENEALLARFVTVLHLMITYGNSASIEIT